ncbi:MAG: SGNH/GDSL hydrolase family protein [Flavobacterium circumlabens]|uniref:SGNH/GDSL hydrolase family protein n=1 Tax=Flavobacterium circumlabens TaxID=2133765 RepID=UPI0032679068
MIKNNKIICVGDSTSLPGHNNHYEDTWFYKLKKDFPAFDCISYFRRSITTEILVTEGGGISREFPTGADCLEFYDPGIVIVQLGIVDCAPRLLNKIDKVILTFLPSNFKNSYIKLLKKIKKRKATNTEVKLDKFQANLKLFLERCILNEVEIVVLIAIPFPDERMVKKNPNIILNVELYNKILTGFSETYHFVKVIYPLDSRNFSENIFEDGYHPNPLGNEIVFQNIKDVIKNYALR